MAKIPSVSVRLDTSKMAEDVETLTDEFIDALARRVIKQIEKIRREEGQPPRRRY